MFRRTLPALLAALVPGVVATAAPASGAPPVTAAAAATGPAPGAPGAKEGFQPADKSGFGTSTSRASRVWFTQQRAGGLGEVFYPDLGTPAARGLQLLVQDRPGHVVRADDAATVTTDQAGRGALAFTQTYRSTSGRWTLRTTTVTDPARPTVLLDVRVTSHDGAAHPVWVAYDPALSNTRDDDAGATRGRALVASDAHGASALAASPALTATSNGYRGTSDGERDLLADGRLDGRYTSAAPGNLVQTGALAVDGRRHRTTTLAVAFGPDADHALAGATASLRGGFNRAARSYAQGWQHYLRGLRRPPSGLTGAERLLYETSAMVLAASEDKTYRGAYVASPSAPWAFGTDEPSGPYHLVWSRDLYQIATGLLAAGDRAGAERALTYLFERQQKADGSYPQNSTVAGEPFWGGLQLDEVALPAVLADQLGRHDAKTWSHVRRAAEFLLDFSSDGHAAPYSPAERWENQSGYSPNTIAAEIAGLVCTARIARANGADADARRYLAVADDWQRRLKSWTVTTNGPYSDRPYFLRLTKDGQPDVGTTYTIGDSGPADVDQRTVIDPSFLDLVRLGVLPAHDRDVVNTLRVVDEQLGVRTTRGLYWHRASFDGYGEQADGSQWEIGLPDGSLLNHGRAWPLLNGERGEYLLASGRDRAAREQLAAMARTAGSAGMLPEQVWDDAPPSGQPGFTPGTPTTSATPLAWTHAQFLRLARDLAASRVVEQPSVVSRRYGGTAG
ncbi:glycoside hydrolase family 15 protein [Angustibacter peucedani]